LTTYFSSLFPGITFSWIANVQARTWSAIRRMRRPSSVAGSYFRPHTSPTASTSGRRMSMWKLLSTPCSIAQVRSSPMPVSMLRLGSGCRLPGGGPTRLNWVNTRFQISTSLPSGIR
jgi:hypothetical protein